MPGRDLYPGREVHKEGTGALAVGAAAQHQVLGIGDIGQAGHTGFSQDIGVQLAQEFGVAVAAQIPGAAEAQRPLGQSTLILEIYEKPVNESIRVAVYASPE